MLFNFYAQHTAELLLQQPLFLHHVICSIIHSMVPINYPQGLAKYDIHNSIYLKYQF